MMMPEEKCEEKQVLNDFNPDNANASDNQLSYDLETSTLTEKKISDIEWDKADEDKPFSNGDDEYRRNIQDQEIQDIIFSRDLKSFFIKLIIGISVTIAGIYVIDAVLIFFDKVPLSDKITTILQYVLTTSIGFLIGNSNKKEQ